MRHEELKLYVGPDTACDGCGRKFVAGEIITVAEGGRYVFCRSDMRLGCMREFVFRKLNPPRALTGVRMVYRERFGQ